MARARIGARDPWDLPHELIRTAKGRVVYYRKRHRFTAKDLLRLATSIELPTDPFEILAYFQTMLVLWAKMALPDPAGSESFQEFMEAEIAAELRKHGDDPADYGIEEPEAAPAPDKPLGRRLFWDFFRGPIKP